MCNYAVIDLETSLRPSDIGTDIINSDPHTAENFIVYSGVSLHNYSDDYVSVVVSKTKDTSSNLVEMLVEELQKANVELLVGQNIKFDLHYLLRHDEFKTWYFENDIRIWDTMLAEYILTGQWEKFASLDFLTKKYKCGEIKDDRMKEAWKEGISTEFIDPDIVVPYLKEDVNKTKCIFFHQLEEARVLELETNINSFDLIQEHMVALQATTYMEHNGMYFDSHACYSHAVSDLVVEKKRLETELIATINEYRDKTLDPVDSVNNAGISTTIFGGKIKYMVDKPVLVDGVPYVYKSGKKKGEIKTKKHTETVDNLGISLGYTTYESKWKAFKWKMPDITPAKVTGLMPVGEQILLEVKELLEDTVPVAPTFAHELNVMLEFIKNVLSWRVIEKDVSTYYLPYSKMTYPDGCIHHTLNHTATATGRLSSSKPNLQNVSNSG